MDREEYSDEGKGGREVDDRREGKGSRRDRSRSKER